MRVITLYPGEAITIDGTTIRCEFRGGQFVPPTTIVGDKLPPESPSTPIGPINSPHPTPWPQYPGFNPGDIICQGGK